MKKAPLITLVLILFVVKAGSAQGPEEIVNWMKKNAYDLETSNPNFPINSPSLDAVFENINIVLAGEANHGARDFVQIRHRLFRHLVENLGFTYFLIEADFAASLAVDDYICHGTGNPIDALRGLAYFHIVNKEGLELIKWMKAYNDGKSEKHKIRFFGIDCQSSVAALQRLKSFFSTVDISFHKRINNLSLIYDPPGYPVGYLDEKYGPRVLPNDTIQMLKNQLMTNRVQYERASSEIEFKLAVRLVESLIQSNEINYSRRRPITREAFMAENVNWILNEFDPKHEKAFLWAHNAHATYGKITQARTNQSWGTLGQMLKERYGNQVYSIATNFSSGSFVVSEIIQDSIAKTTVKLEPAPKDTFSFLLAQTGREVFFIDFRGTTDQIIRQWLNNNRVKLRSTGGLFHPAHQYSWYILTENLDGLIFINTIQQVTLDLN